MYGDIQRASLWKRIAAWLFDSILLSILAVAFGLLLAFILNYNSYSTTLDQAYAEYEAKFGITFNISQEAYLSMTPGEQQKYDAAYDALIADNDVLVAYNMVVNLSMIILTVGFLFATLILEVIIPLVFKNGQTVGKRIFSLAVVRNDAVQVNVLQLFTRSILGKFTIETMLPIYIVILIFFSGIGFIGTLILIGLFAAQIILLLTTRSHTLIHDLLAGAIVVDFSSQRIFKSTEELLAYTKRVHAEEAARKSY